MSDIIKNYYEQNKTPKFLLDKKLAIFNKHLDIAKEFEDWIQFGKYKDNGALIIEGFTAKQLSELSKYLNGEGAFIMMTELRDNPEKALMKIKEGFTMK